MMIFLSVKTELFATFTEYVCVSIEVEQTMIVFRIMVVD